MSKLLRYYHPGQVYFVTTVTHKRARILSDNAGLLWRAIEKVKDETDFQIMAWVIMPDHFHFIIDPKDQNLSNIMRRIKLSFAHAYRPNASLYRGQIWQRRFWDHIIRNEKDLNNHTDYIHYNPVKHGLTKNPFDWQYSSIQQYLENGYYSLDWGVIDHAEIDADYGE